MYTIEEFIGANGKINYAVISPAGKLCIIRASKKLAQKEVDKGNAK